MSGYLVALGAPGEDGPLFFPAPLVQGGASGRRRYDLPAVLKLVQAFAGAELAVLERSQPMPKNGGIANFQSGAGYMLWRVALTAAGIPYEAIPPASWKAELRVRGQGKTTSARRKDGKRRAVELAQQLYPGVTLLPSERCRVSSADMAEALLLAHLAKKT